MGSVNVLSNLQPKLQGAFNLLHGRSWNGEEARVKPRHEMASERWQEWPHEI